jgi:hypothetical protein
MKKIIILLAVLALLPLANAGAQSSFTVFQTEISWGPAYSPGSSAWETVWGLGLAVMVSDNIAVGYNHVWASTPLDIFSLKYRLQNQLRALLSISPDFSATALTSVGLGFEYIPFSGRAGPGATEIKLLMEFFFALDNFTNNRLFIGLGLGLGV